MKNKVIISLVAGLVLIIAGYWSGMFLDKAPKEIVPSATPAPAVVQNDQPAPATQPTATGSTGEIQSLIQLDVPFIVQAPFGNWSNPVFQNGCEEASIAMAMNWIKGVDDVSQFSARKQILDIVDFEDANFGYNTDTDVFDVAKIFQRYFHWQNVTVAENISLDDIKRELQKGNVVLVPAFGQALGNPNYTAPGPVEHMLVVIGYDPATHEFITNDPGTRRGANYRYREDSFFKAIWSYPSGASSAAVPVGTLKKAMVVVGK